MAEKQIVNMAAVAQAAVLWARARQKCLGGQRVDPGDYDRLARAEAELQREVGTYMAHPDGVALYSR